MAKLEKVSELVTVEDRGSACIGGMSSEDTYYRFITGSGRKLLWHGGNANHIYLERGTRVYLVAFVRPVTAANGKTTNYLQKVKVTPAIA